MSTYLVWSNDAHGWWGPNRCGYTGDVWQAGRYSPEEAADVCRTRSWPDGAPPPEVMVVAPEDGRGSLSMEECRQVPEWMRGRVKDATRKAIAQREAAQQSGEAASR